MCKKDVEIQEVVEALPRFGHVIIGLGGHSSGFIITIICRVCVLYADHASCYTRALARRLMLKLPAYASRYTFLLLLTLMIHFPYSMLMFVEKPFDLVFDLVEMWMFLLSLFLYLIALRSGRVEVLW